MKRTLWFLPLWILATLVFADQPPAYLAGTWLGTFGTIRVVFQITEKPNHDLDVIVQSPDQTTQDIPTDHVSFKDGQLHFDAMLIKASFDGKLSPDGSELSGTWKQKGVSSLLLKKTDKVPGAERIPEAKDADELKPQIDALVNPLIKGDWINAMTVGVIYKGQTRVWGYGNMASKGKKLPDGDTEFEVGSITKLFTRLLFIDMIQKGQMQLDDPAQKYLPADVQMPSFHGKQITLYHLAEHLSGLPHDPDDIDWNGPDKDPQSKYILQQLYNYLGRVKLTREPGAQPEYSNTGVALLGDLIATKSGMSYQDYLQQLVCQPLGLKDTGVTWTQDQVDRAAQGHGAEGDPTDLWKWTEPTYIGAGAIHSTVNDMLKLAQELFEPTAEPLSKLTTGPLAEKLDWGPLVAHDGQTNEFNSSFYVDRKNKIAVVTWGNRANLKTSAVSAEIRKAVHGLKPTPLDLPEVVLLPAAQLKPYVGRYAVEQITIMAQSLVGRIYKLTAKKGHLVSTDEKTKETSNFYLTSKGDLFEKTGMLYSFIKNDEGQVVGVATKPGQLYSATFRKLDADGKPLEGSLVAKGKSLAVEGDRVKVDDFETGKTQNLLGGQWRVEFDDRQLGTVLKNKDQFIVKGGADGSQYCGRIFGHFGQNRAPWPFVDLQTSLDAREPVDLSGFKAVEFKAKGDGKAYEVMLYPSQVTDYAYFRADFKASPDWALQHMDLDSFHQPNWGSPVLRDFHAVKEILFQPSGMNNEDFDLWIDDVTLVK